MCKDNEDLLKELDEISEDESGVSGESFSPPEDDIDNDLDIDSDESLENIQNPFKVQSVRNNEDPFPTETPPFHTENNINLSNENESQSADNTPDDLVDDIEIEDEEDEDESDSESFAPSKALTKSKKTMKGVLIIAGVVLVLVVLIVPQLKRNKKKKEEKKDVVDTEQILRDMKNYSGRDLSKLEQRKKKPGIKETPIHQNSNSGITRKKTSGIPRKGHRPRGSNYRRDKSIIDKYQQVNPEHASGGGTVSGTASSGSQGSTSGDMMNLPERRGKGGLNIIGGGTAKNKDKKAGIYNLELKAFLKFGVRSTSGSQIVAVLKEDKGPFRKGDLFYGSASFKNKRTFISFEKAVSGGNEMDLKGRALFGRDPGIPSEVTEIATGNASSSGKSAVIGVVGKVADKALSNVTQGATDGALSEPTSDLQGQHEEEKEQYEYFVPANTVFTIYVY